MIQTLAFMIALGAMLPIQTPQTSGSQPPALSGIQEPEDISVIHYLNTKNVPIPLEMHRAQYQTRDSAFRGSQETLVISGTTSPVQFTEGELPTFVVQVLLPMQLPTEYELFPLVIRKKENQRAVILTEQGFWTDTGSRGYHLRVQRYGQNSFKIISSSPLPPGEYAFKYGLSASKSKDLYCFTIVAKPRL
ncbi:hypothetical protein [Armatimonas sp.]|uniref:hypothetical protein n=1 Tax=Armatimonas sp. TaxID=1872638 RepID=UPI00286C44C8|nr:hypothetical protein [Armatimonas sp.]